MQQLCNIMQQKSALSMSWISSLAQHKIKMQLSASFQWRQELLHYITRSSGKKRWPWLSIFLQCNVMLSGKALQWPIRYMQSIIPGGLLCNIYIQCSSHNHCNKRESICRLCWLSRVVQLCSILASDKPSNSFSLTSDWGNMPPSVHPLAFFYFSFFELRAICSLNIRYHLLGGWTASSQTSFQRQNFAWGCDKPSVNSQVTFTATSTLIGDWLAVLPVFYLKLLLLPLFVCRKDIAMNSFGENML